VDHDVAGSTWDHSGVPVGTTVAVRTRYLEGQWARGYEIAEVLPRGYRVRRRGSRELLSGIFAAADIRAEASR